ncbi:hypothetical protein HZY95_00885 [Staphylococcus sciuri]|uniref:hypothetical protein n=1 Tax=Mammaliicoccus sciuri TaxID=1296 RepID=UPI0015CFBF42|nr:hypothetical protein [Mammaliicoccus sciuri]MBF0718283.1 hypothetical protein [Mammaliicoccus sciuri]NYS37044.1 hypothetical protein [Mammaliicoccus sciuri]
MNKSKLSRFLFFRSMLLILSICFFCLLVASIVIFKKRELPKIIDTNLGVIINSINENFITALIFSSIPLFASLSAIFLVHALYKDLYNPLFVKMLTVSYVGLFPMLLISSIILLATKPSDTTIVFTIFSYIGASILYISTIYTKTKKDN